MRAQFSMCIFSFVRHALEHQQVQPRDDVPSVLHELVEVVHLFRLAEGVHEMDLKMPQLVRDLTQRTVFGALSPLCM